MSETNTRPGSEAWHLFAEATTVALAAIEDDRDPLNDRERADGHQYVLRMLAAVAEASMVRLDPDRPSFLPMLDTVRYLGAAGPDIDYDVAVVRPGGHYRIRGHRGGATYVGIAVYEGSGEAGATAIVLSVDVDSIVDDQGDFEYEFSHETAARVIIRQYFHDRSAQDRGRWSIERLDSSVPVVAGERRLASSIEIDHRVMSAARSLRWNAGLNRLWTPDRRDHPQSFVRQTSTDIVAAIPNPDVVYSFSWWRAEADEVVVVDLAPPDAPYWSVQLCDRWFQCYPDRQAGLNDRQVVRRADGTVKIVIAASDPGVGNWLDNGGHRVGVVFFRWLHSDIARQPMARVMSRDALVSDSNVR